MKRFLIAAACLLSAAASAEAADVVTSVPPGAIVHSLPQRLDITFPDGSTYDEMAVRLDVKGPQAVAWFLGRLPDADPQKLVKPADMLSFTVIRDGNGGVVRMDIEYADHSEYHRLPVREDVTGALASHYVNLIRAYERDHPSTR
jgi:hypothetical protein